MADDVVAAVQGDGTEAARVAKDGNYAAGDGSDAAGDDSDAADAGSDVADTGSDVANTGSESAYAGSESADTDTEHADAGAMPVPSPEPDVQSPEPSVQPGPPNPVPSTSIDNAFVLNAIIAYLNQAKADIVNKPIKFFAQILTELDTSNKELHQCVIDQGNSVTSAVQETAHAITSETIRIAEQNDESLRKSQELALTIISEIKAATATLQEANRTAATELGNNFTQALAAQPATKAPATTTGRNLTTDYILYICLAMLAFTIFNLFVTIYAVNLIRS